MKRMGLKRYSLDQIPSLKVWGRTGKERKPLTLFWNASGVEFSVKASEMWVELTADYGIFEPWVDVLINDALTQRFMLNKGTQKVCLFRGMNPAMIKKVQLFRDTPAMPADDRTLLQVGDVYTDGSFEPVREYDLKIEFIGDSITSGEGCTGAIEEEDWISGCFSAITSYPCRTARKLHAEYHCVSQSGWGFYWSWEGKKENSIPRFYEKVCGLVKGEKNLSSGAGEMWDFSSWKPDVIVVNLGTNDGTPFGLCNDPYMAKGGDLSADFSAMKDAGYQFLKQLRRCNPESQIIWAYGMLGRQMSPCIREFLSHYQDETGDRKVHFLELPDCTGDMLGARMHPGSMGHEAAAEALAQEIRRLTGRTDM